MKRFIKQTVWALLALVSMTTMSCSKSDDVNNEEQKTHSIALTYYLDDVKLGELNGTDLDSIIGKTTGFSTKYTQGEQVKLTAEANEVDGYKLVAFESKTDPKKTGAFSYTFNLDKLEEFVVKFETIKEQQGYKVETEIYVDGVRKITTRGYNWDTAEGYTTGMGLYHSGEPATVTAFANSGYELIKFDSPARNGNSTYTWEVKNNEKFVVQFRTKPLNYPVSCSITGSGTVKINGQPLVNGTEYPNGTYTLTAHPAAGWSSNWTTKQITVSNAAVNEAVVFTKDTPKQAIQVSIREYPVSSTLEEMVVTIDGVRKTSTGEPLTFDNLKADVRYNITVLATGRNEKGLLVQLVSSISPKFVILQEGEKKHVSVSLSDRM